MLFHEWCERKNLLCMTFAHLENSKAVNNPVFIPLSWDNFQVHCRTLLITQPKHVICQFFQYIYHSKTHILGYAKKPNRFKFCVNTVMPHSSCESSLAWTMKTKCHLYTEVNFYKGIMWINFHKHASKVFSITDGRSTCLLSHIHYCKNIREIEQHLEKTS